MTQFSKVVWSEGTFITPQHLQQSDRYYDSLVQECICQSRSNAFGFINLEINENLLSQGQFDIAMIQAVFPDGTYFSPGNIEIGRLQVEIPINTKPSKLYLVLSKTSDNNNAFAFEDEQSNTRYVVSDRTLFDTVDITLEPKKVALATLNAKIVLEEDLADNVTKLPLAIISSDNNGQISLDNSYIPPQLSAQNNQKLKSYIEEINGLLLQRSEKLALGVNDPNRGGSLEVIDFLMLQTVNRYLPYLNHHHYSSNKTHPEDLFVTLSQLCADLLTFSPEKLFKNMPIYNHLDIAKSFSDLILELRKSLSTVIQKRVFRIDLTQKDETTYTAQTPDKSILDTANFILAAKADMPALELRQKLPSIMKISTIDGIQELVEYHMPGIKLDTLASAPRELPFHSGYVYFELEQENKLWEEISLSAGMAFHIAGDFPNIDFEFWAIKPTV